MNTATCPVHNVERALPELSQPFRFLDLPPEIRNRIASYALTSPSTIRIRRPQYNRHAPPSPEPMFTTPRLDYPLPRTPPPTPPCEDFIAQSPDKFTQEEKESHSRQKDGHSRLALLMACKRTYTDHWATYYSDNCFSFTPGTWEKFRSHLPDRCLEEIRHIKFRMPYRSRQMSAWRSLASLQSLQDITVILAPPELASTLERANCVAGTRMCPRLQSIKIEREGVGEGIAPLGEGEDGLKAKEAIKHDKLIERSINKILEEKTKRPCLMRRSAQSSVVRKATTRAGSHVRSGKRLRRRESPMPDEESMDEYFRIVDSGTDGEVDVQTQS